MSSLADIEKVLHGFVGCGGFGFAASLPWGEGAVGCGFEAVDESLAVERADGV